MSQSKTPRTDKALFTMYTHCDEYIEAVEPDIAKQLETELAEAVELLEEWTHIYDIESSFNDAYDNTEQFLVKHKEAK